MVFEDRSEAGRFLFHKLEEYSRNKNVLIIALPRGGVVGGKVLSQMLHLPLDILVIKKMGAPQNPELAVGAVGPEGVVYWDEDLLQKIGVNKYQGARIKDQKEKERSDLENTLRNKKPPIDVKDKTIILVDDGVATGSTVLCAQKYLKKKKTKQIILAVPVVSSETLRKLAPFFDKIITLAIEKEFFAVGQFYRKFSQVENEEVKEMLKCPTSGLTFSKCRIQHDK